MCCRADGDKRGVGPRGFGHSVGPCGAKATVLGCAGIGGSVGYRVEVERRRRRGCRAQVATSGDNQHDYVVATAGEGGERGS